MLIHVYVDYGKGWVKFGSATVVGNSSVDLTNVKLPQAAKRAAICAQADVLALKHSEHEVTFGQGPRRGHCLAEKTA
jgi:hypothetical protein